MSKPVVLIILDGWGEAPPSPSNAIYYSNTPTWDNLIAKYPHTQLSGCGTDVGLPTGQMGNSEVGHLVMGAGRVIPQNLSKISAAIKSGEFASNPVLTKACQITKQRKSALHIMGLLSPGGVHSHEEHFLACMQLAQQQEVDKLFVHAFLDGRDTPPKSAMSSLQKLDSFIDEFPGAQLASVSGRYFAMDRDQRWERTEQAYSAIVNAEAKYQASNGQQALSAAYERGETDEFVTPTTISSNEAMLAGINNNDVVIFINFRADRARQLCYALANNNFTEFETKPIKLAELVTLTEYDSKLPAKVAFAKSRPINSLGEVLAKHNLKQLRVAETEKYAHVTFFFNGGIEQPFPLEDRVLVPSPKVATYDLCPQMSAEAVTEELVKNITNKSYDVIICNYANADMVGHTGNFTATVKAIETLDTCLKKVVDALIEVDGSALITADHGNAEQMIDHQTNQPHTAHTTSVVPLVYVGSQNLQFQGTGTLSDLAPTLLRIMNISPPKEMTGRDLFVCGKSQ